MQPLSFNTLQSSKWGKTSVYNCKMRWHIKYYGSSDEGGEFFPSRRVRKSLKIEITSEFSFEWWVEFRNSDTGKITFQLRKDKGKIPDVNSCLLLLKGTRWALGDKIQEVD